MAVLLACAAAGSLALPAQAGARPYTVYSCDAAGLWGFASHAWVGDGVPGSAYAVCPSHGSGTNGISTRLVDRYFPAGAHSRQAFNAPPGTTITGFRWSGRFKRNECTWKTSIESHPGGHYVFGFRAFRECATGPSFDTGSAVIGRSVRPGTTALHQAVQCAASSCGPGATFHTRFIEVMLDDPRVPSVAVSGALASGRWVNGQEVVQLRASDNTGVREISASLSGAQSQQRTFGCNPTLPRPCSTPVATNVILATSAVEDGAHTLSVSAVDAADNVARTTRTVRIDNTPPAPARVAAVGGEGWRRKREFAVRWENAVQEHAPMAGAHWELCSPAGCTRGSAAAAGIQELRDLAVPGPGEHTLRVWLEDAAGNTREGLASEPVHVRFDPVAPTVAFEPQAKADPLRVAAAVHDGHSGIAGGQIELRAEGGRTWHALPTRLEDGRLVGYVDDQRLEDGPYRLRARAVDRAGNETTSDRRRGGETATFLLPARFVTRLRVGLPKVVVRRRVVRRRGRRRVVRRRLVRHRRRVSVRLGRRARLHGRLANGDGQPLEGTTVEVFEEQPGGDHAPLGLAHADGRGRFRYVARATRSRVLLFRYPGTRRIAPSSARVGLRVPAATSIGVSRASVRNGQRIRFGGRVRSRPLPSQGKLVEVQAHFRGRWRTISTVRTGEGGRWRFPYRFGGTVGRVRYRFRALLPREGGYPFARGRSRTVGVLVRGY